MWNSHYQRHWRIKAVNIKSKKYIPNVDNSILIIEIRPVDEKVGLSVLEAKICEIQQKTQKC